MERNMDLIREILIYVKNEADDLHAFKIEVDGYEQNLIEYNTRLLGKEGYLEGRFSGDRCTVHALTWKGHDFLDNAMNDNIWNKTKQIVKEKGGSVSFTILTDLIKQVASSHFNLK